MVKIKQCVVPEKIHTHPTRRSLELPKGEGVLKATFLEAMYENKLEFPRGRGVAKPKTFRGGVWVFSGTAK